MCTARRTAFAPCCWRRRTRMHARCSWTSACAPYLGLPRHLRRSIAASTAGSAAFRPTLRSRRWPPWLRAACATNNAPSLSRFCLGRPGGCFACADVIGSGGEALTCDVPCVFAHDAAAAEGLLAHFNAQQLTAELLSGYTRSACAGGGGGGCCVTAACERSEMDVLQRRHSKHLAQSFRTLVWPERGLRHRCAERRCCHARRRRCHQRCSAVRHRC